MQLALNYLLRITNQFSASQLEQFRAAQIVPSDFARQRDATVASGGSLVAQEWKATSTPAALLRKPAKAGSL
ncbi:MAG: hypothetical protein SP1CHLAM54_05960 [Chlamydiia bacterium]|nr:hypothetical protein [Chlamydiia bacterium]MCH9615506.1 hypothetical protein [Chlamydiia bacterium]MCH9629161.1 hypothetical protein [Chlamydiia bacterium]